MTHDRKPFFAGTYFPKASRFGQIGMLELLPKIHEFWTAQRSELIRNADRILAGIEPDSAPLPAGGKDPTTRPPADLMDEAYRELRMRYDPIYGGFGEAPKFPSPHAAFISPPVLESDRRSRRARHGRKNARGDAQRRHLRPDWRRLPPVRDRPGLDRPAFRKDALRSGSPGDCLHGSLPGHGHGRLRADRQRGAGLFAEGPPVRRRGILLRRGCRKRGQGRKILSLDGTGDLRGARPRNGDPGLEGFQYPQQGKLRRGAYAPPDRRKYPVSDRHPRLDR